MVKYSGTTRLILIFVKKYIRGVNDSLEKAEVAESETQVGYREGAEVVRLLHLSIGQGPSPSVEHLEALELELRWGCRRWLQ